MAFACAPGAIGFVNRCVRRLLELEKAQRSEDPRYAEEYRYAGIILRLAFEGDSTPVTTAAYRIFGCHPDQVWWRIRADRMERLGREYALWYGEDGRMLPDRPIPDFDPTLGKLPVGRIF